MKKELSELTARVVAAFVSSNSVPFKDLPDIISTVHDALANADKPPEPEKEKLVPAVSIRKSITPDYIVCLEDGRKLKMLKRHLRTVYDMTPDQYRAKWGLPADYPMVAPNYTEKRSQFAKTIGLGRKAKAAPEPAPAPAPRAKRGRRKAA